MLSAEDERRETAFLTRSDAALAARSDAEAFDAVRLLAESAGTAAEQNRKNTLCALENSLRFVCAAFGDEQERWILLHVSMRVNISLVSDFFIKLLRLPMGFFDTRLMGDLMQRMGDHKRVEQYLTNEALTVLFSLLTFLVFGGVLLVYDPLIFAVFVAGSLLYGLWIAFFLGKRKRIDYELFEKEAENNNKTYRFITTMQEIKLQDCEQRRRWEWEDVQALKIHCTPEADTVINIRKVSVLCTKFSLQFLNIFPESILF